MWGKQWVINLEKLENIYLALYNITWIERKLGMRELEYRGWFSSINGDSLEVIDGIFVQELIFPNVGHTSDASMDETHLDLYAVEDMRKVKGNRGAGYLWC